MPAAVGQNTDATRVRVYRAEDGALLGVARLVDGVLAPERLVAPPPAA
jgi:tRNA pseudouridine55 synthase